MNERKTIIFFRALGNDTYGMGHIYRSLSLATALKQHSSIYLPIFIIRRHETMLAKLIEKQGFQYQEFKELHEKGKSLLVYDMPCLEVDIISAEHLFSHILGLDYFYENKITLSLNLFTHNQTKSFPFEIKEGIQFALLNNNILNTKQALTPSRQQVDNILLTFGSLDPQNNTLTALKQLVGFTGNICIILGPLYSHRHSLINFINQNPTLTVKLIENSQGIGEYISQSELVFCGGGTTLLECIYLAKPTIVLSQTTAESSFAKHLEKQGLCSVNKVNLLSFNEREQIRNRCLQTAIGHGTSLIINNIEELLNA
jgi:spore coat polysaccharide biosynthesis predicted glycosyltransferase SpsG